MRSWKILFGLALVAIAGGVHAQGAYPSRPIRIIVPFGPGGVTDVLARLLAPHIQNDFGQPLVIENIGGAGGVIGTAAAAKAAPDGYTIMFTSNVHSINPALRKQLPFDAVRDFTPITLLVSSPNLLVVRADSPFKSVSDYIAAAKEKPGEVSFATAGLGTSLHIAGEQFSQLTGTRFNHIPYSASNQSVQAAAAGTTNSSWSAVNSALPMIKGGRLRALAVASPQRTVFLPDVPTFEEAGVKGMKSETWLGVIGPGGLPAAIAAKWNAELLKLINRADIKEKIFNLGAEPVGTELDKFGALIKEEIEMYSAIVRAGNIKPE
jgi:tripartite-type tricarboxylate transporter receptor subunit TctC